MEVFIDADGSLRAIHDDDLTEMLGEVGTLTIRRASRVEPAQGGWSADMAPVDGPVLGPFAKRRDALAAEVEWLKSHGTPTPRA